MDISQKIVMCNDRTLQLFLRGTDSVDVAYLITNHLNEDATKALLRNMSPAAAQMLIEDRDKMKNAISKSDSLLTTLIEQENGFEGEKTILFTDLVSSSEKANLLGDDLYYERVLCIHNDTIQNEISKNDGNTIKIIGDSFLVIFASPVNALSACLDIQGAFRKHNDEVDPEYRIFVRMVLHQGVLQYKTLYNGQLDIFGSSVNFASRILGIAGGGEICASMKYVEDIMKLADEYENRRELYQESEYYEKNIEGLETIITEYKQTMAKVRFETYGMHSFKGFEGEQEIIAITNA